jgi:hypothetical protein
MQMSNTPHARVLQPQDFESGEPLPAVRNPHVQSPRVVWENTDPRITLANSRHTNHPQS